VRKCVEHLLSLLPDSRIEGAATVAEGRARAAEGWDLVISDFALPDGNGLAILDACATSNPAAQRVLMSAYEDHPEVVAALRTSALSAFIQKPFEPETFLDRVQRLLRTGR
jgi:DNA-binding NtrC family response regulator